MKEEEEELKCVWDKLMLILVDLNKGSGVYKLFKYANIKKSVTLLVEMTNSLLQPF